MRHDAVEQIRLAAPLHDVGKIAVPDAILLKPGALTAEERTIMQRHTTSGAELLSGSSSSLLLLAERIAAAHHERWDGGGYPLGLARKEIDVAARITSVAEIVDALVHRRPYKEAWSLADAMDYIVHGAGSQFDPAVVTAFSRMDPQVLAATTEPDLPLAAGLRGVTTPSR